MFQCDLEKNSGDPSALTPHLERPIAEADWQTRPHPDGLAIRIEVAGARTQVAFRFLAGGVLTIEVPVTTLPAPAPDELPLTLGKWNSQVQGLKAVSQRAGTDVAVVLRRDAVAPQGSDDPFPKELLAQAVDQLAREKAELAPVLALMQKSRK